MTSFGRRSRRLFRASRFAFVAAVLGCSQAPSGERKDLRRELLQSWGERLFVPNYREFESAAAELNLRAAELCDIASEEALSSTQEGWRRARAPWKRNDLLAFGPYTDEPLRFGPKIDFWPARVENITEVLSAEAPLGPEAISAMGASQRGFPAIEYLLFQPDVDIVEVTGENPHRCEYLKGLTEDLAVQAEGIRKAWDPNGGNYLDELVQAGRSSESFDTIDMALGEIVNRLIFTVENLRGDRFGGPLGIRSGGTAQPDAAESRFSGRSLDDVRDTLRGVEDVCFGEGESDSLAAYLERIQHPELVAILRDEFVASFEAIDAIEGPLTTAVLEDPESVQRAIDVLARLQRVLQVDVINAMGLTLTFNDNDGD